MCVFLLSRFSLVAVNKAFYCGVVSAIADTVSVQGVPVPGPNPQTNSKEGQGQPLLLLSLGIKAEELYLTLKLYCSRLHVSGFDFAVRDEKWYLTNLKIYSFNTTSSNPVQSALYMAILQILFILVFFIEQKHKNTLTGLDKGIRVKVTLKINIGDTMWFNVNMFRKWIFASRSRPCWTAAGVFWWSLAVCLCSSQSLNDLTTQQELVFFTVVPSCLFPFNSFVYFFAQFFAQDEHFW